MLMSDTWQPSVLQLLPFSANNASHHHHPASSFSSSSSLTPPHPTSSSSTSPRYPLGPDGGSRGFPVLAVTRKENHHQHHTGTGSRGWSEDGGGGGGGGKSSGRRRGGGSGGGVGGWGGVWASPPSPPTTGRVRASSERMTRTQAASLDAGGGGGGGKDVTSSSASAVHPRAKSECPTASHGRLRSGGLQSRDHPTCTVTDLNDRIVARVGFRPDTSSSHDSALGSLRNSPYVTSAATETSCSNGVGGSVRGLPKPAFPANALSPSNNSAAAVIGSGNSGVGEGRVVVSKNGMWRSVTLTPGEMELKRHRDLLERVGVAPPAPGKGESKSGQQYHKMNVRDLPRSTTPVNDHDPDKLNMKQVIAFLQSKGKSQADAVELPRGPKSTVCVTLPDTVKPGVFRGSVKRPTAPTAADILMRSSGRPRRRDSTDASPSSAVAAQKGEGSGDTHRSSPSLPVTRNSTAKSVKSSGKDGKEQRREHRDRTQERSDPHARASSSSEKLQKKPFRLHRFLTMVPTARDSQVDVTPAPSASAGSCPLYSSVPLVSRSSKSAHKERTLCLDLATHSKTQNTLPRCPDSKQQGKVHYRLGARPRPSSLRVEQDLSETLSKLSADFGDRDVTNRRVTVADSSSGHPNTNAKEAKNVIRLPFVMVDSEDEDASAPSESRKSSKPQAQKHAKQQLKKPSRRTPETNVTVEEEASNETEGTDCQWPTDVKETPELQPSSHISATSSMLPAQTPSSSSTTTSGLPTVVPADAARDQTQMVQDYVDTLPHVLTDPGSTTDLAVRDTAPDRPVTNKKLKVNVPSHSDLLQATTTATKQKLPDCVTLSLRKERHRTRESTYMSEIGGSDVFSDDTCAARVNSESVRMSFRSDDVASLAS
ncbi:uncharacterized protein LOC143297893 [Babylonia areolata]|uniref:uncharacterized protein LOC143297893 n=1 Tax=Babylonia areolata TaxID=304850 RepID=UPI003FD40A01